MPSQRDPRRQHQNLFALWHREQQHATHVDGDGSTCAFGWPDVKIQTSIDNQVVIDWWEPKDRKGKKLSTGTFAIQAHDPKSVVEYKFIKARHLDPKEMTRAESLDTRLSMQSIPEKEWWNRMDHGPFVSCATGYPMDYATANKASISSRMDGWPPLIPVYCELVRYGKVA